MLDRVITGGQTGADSGAIVAAHDAGIPVGGWAARGWMTEDGPFPQLRALGLLEAPRPGYSFRRRLNVRDCDGSLLFGDATSPGSRGLIKDCREMGKPLMHVEAGQTRPSQVVAFLDDNPHIKVLLVAGNRESRSPGIGARVERFLAEVFRQFGHRTGS